MIKLPPEEPRCLAYDTPTPQRKKLPDWCALRETCARAVALRSDGYSMTGRIIDYRVCKVGETDAFIEVQP